MKACAVQVQAPVQGWAMPLSEVPDQAFAEKMVGDGVAIDPIGGELHAPCDGEVVSIHRSQHALTIRAENGAEFLLHVGVDTVALNGQGFTSYVANGQRVKAGDLLLTFDMDLIAAKAKSLQTMVILANSDEYEVSERLENQMVAEGAFLMKVHPTAETLQKIDDGRSEGGEESGKTVRLLIANGLHARPAAALANQAKLYEGKVEISLHDRKANGKSVVSLMSLGVRYGDALHVCAQGAGASQAVDGLVKLIEAGLGDEVVPASVAGGEAVIEPTGLDQPDFTPGEDLVLKGVGAAPGVSVGVVVRVERTAIDVEEQGKGCEVEQKNLLAALASAKTELEASVVAAIQSGDAAREGIFQAHLALLDDPELTGPALVLIEEGKSAGFAWRTSIERYVAVLRALTDPLLAERVNDLLDLEQRILLVLTGRSQPTQALPENAVLIADDLMPSQLVGPSVGHIVGTCTALGGTTAHVAILAASMGIPAVVAAGSNVLRIPDGTTVILDGDRGVVRVNPSPEAIVAAREKIAARQERHAANIVTAKNECVMSDGRKIDVFANLAQTKDAVVALSRGADGCGLLRTEFLFMSRSQAPSEDEQLAEYQAIATALEGRPLVIRTLDVGGDKPLRYLRLPPEDNPVLGLRGVRVGMMWPDLLRTQIRAILRVEPVGQCKIMVPMVASLSELQFVRTIVDEERFKLGRRDPIELGIMVEVPAAAAITDILAREADFFSIGTNDLTQYVLGIDRGNSSLAMQYDAMHPAVLRMIAMAAEGAMLGGRPLSVCGGMASDPLAAPLLIGLNVTKLSATATAVPDVKAFIRTLSFDECRGIARKAMDAESPEAVRKLVTDRWPGL